MNPDTLVITNFSGRLSRILNGDINSGFAKFKTSWGYDPFSKPMNLSWLEQPVDITGAVKNAIVTAKPRFEAGVNYVYGVGHSSGGGAATIYKIEVNSSSNPNIDSVIQTASIAANSPSFLFGGSIDFYGSTQKIYIGSDGQVNSINFDFTGDTKIGTNGYVSNVFRPLKQFVGKLLFGNGNTIGAIDASGTVTSSIIGTGLGNLYSEINPPLPVSSRITDIDSSEDGNYLLITSSGVPNENILTVANDRQAAAASDGSIFRWNGVDAGITSFSTIPSYAVTAMQVYLKHNIFFSDDAFGGSLNDGTSKLLTLPNNKAPFANATLVNGNFVSWIAPEIIDDTSMVGSLYYFGSLDLENPPGLYRLTRHSTDLAGGYVYQTPVNIMTNNIYKTVNNAITAIIPLGYGKHYFSTIEINNTTTEYKLYRFLVTPSGSGTPQAGVYETQTQLFSKRKSIKQIRVYTEPTVAGNGFQIDLIGSDGEVIDNGTFNYSFVAGSDLYTLKGSLERINFNPSTINTYALGVRITNTGSTNMTVKKVEVDISDGGV